MGGFLKQFSIQVACKEGGYPGVRTVTRSPSQYEAAVERKWASSVCQWHHEVNEESMQDLLIAAATEKNKK